MKTQDAICPPESILSEFGLGKLDPASAETISQHLDTCADCRQRVAALSADSFVARLRAVPAQASGPLATPDRTFVEGESAHNTACSSETRLDEPQPAAPLAR